MSINRVSFVDRFMIIAVALPLSILFALLKILLHHLSWEPFQLNLLPFYTTSLMGIVFILGFLLAGVLSDYKESEKIPCEIAAALVAIWQEADVQARAKSSHSARALQKKVCKFVDVFKADFLINRSDYIFEVLDSFFDQFEEMDKQVPAPFMVRLRNEHANIRRLLIRIKCIRETRFAHKVFLLVATTIVCFLVSMLLLKVEPFSEGVFFMCLFVFLLISILVAIRDFDDPFEYSEESGIRTDEVSFEVVFEFGAQMKGRTDSAVASSL